MRLGTTYICVEDMGKSLAFYKALLQMEPAEQNSDRWATFACGNCLSLYNKHFDEKLLQTEPSGCFNQAYLEDFRREEGARINNLVIFNFEVEDLAAEYDRIRSLQIGEVSELMYVNVHMPYWYFNVKDPDGNLLEITGPYCP